MGKFFSPVLFGICVSLAFCALIPASESAASKSTVSCGENRFYNIEQKSCLDCGCNNVGSASPQCDELGICKCVVCYS